MELSLDRFSMGGRWLGGWLAGSLGEWVAWWVRIGEKAGFESSSQGYVILYVDGWRLSIQECLLRWL